MAFKIAVDAGHYYGEPGRRCLKSVDTNETREWTMNDRVANYFMLAASEYKDVELLRVDDPTGKKNISIYDRATKANSWGADLYLSFHHDAGINGGKGGGITTFAYKNGGKAEKYRNAIYDAVIAAGGLKGNRAEPKKTANFVVLKNTVAPAVLTEYGFMDSVTDIPYIITSAYSKKVGYATMEGVAKIANLKKKEETKVAKTKFKDEAKIPSWALDAVKNVSDDGIMLGDDKGNFRPNDFITRAEFAVAIDRLRKL